MFGYSEESKGYRIWLNENKKIIARYVKFLEKGTVGMKSNEENNKLFSKQEETKMPVKLRVYVICNN